MKKYLLALCFAFLPFTSYADVALNSTACVQNAGDDLSGCFQNTTGSDLDSAGLVLETKTVLKDGTKSTTDSPLTPFANNNYVSISTSKDALKQQSIDKVVYKIMQDGNDLNNCKIVIAKDQQSQQMLTIQQKNKKIHC